MLDKVDERSFTLARQTRATIFPLIANFYRRFVENITHIVNPLNDMLQKNHCNPSKIIFIGRLSLFWELIEALTSAPILHHSQPLQPYLIDTDISDHQVDCVLFQTNAEIVRCPIRYFRQTLYAAERNYLTAEKKRLAVFWTLRILCPYLAWEHFTIFTNHLLLLLQYNHSYCLLNVSKLSRCLIRLRLRLFEFGLDIQ